MCSIILLEPGYTLPYPMLENAVYNNPHGYGLILRDPKHKKMQVIKGGKKSLEEGNDPKEIYDLLKDNEDVERYLHVRWKTEGEISEENVQPFSSFSSNKKDILFMHNGTLHDYKPATGYTQYQNGTKITDPKETASDSKKFNDQVLVPLFARFNGENGKGDIKDEVIQLVIHKFWGTASHNKGILISSDQGAVLINKSGWETIKDGDKSFIASNNTYFDKLSRGPEYERRKKVEEDEKKANAKVFQSSSNSSVVKLKNLLVENVINLPVNARELLNDVDVYSQEGLYELRNMTAHEWDDFIKSGEGFDNAVSLFIHLTDEYAKIYDKYNKAASHLASLDNKEPKVG